MKYVVYASFGSFRPKNKRIESAEIDKIQEILEDIVSSGEYGDVDLDIASQMYLEWVDGLVNEAMQRIENS